MPVAFRDLPAVHRIQADPRLSDFPPALVKQAADALLDELRAQIRADELHVLPDVVALLSDRLVTWMHRRIRPVLNATGVVLHTNLGRAPWSQAAVDAAAAASGYCDLEMSLQTGHRGGRTEGVRQRVCALTGAEDMVVVNNCAAALLLALTALARDQEVLVSRGELVEIGGSFRVPDIIEAGGARLVPVGTTNRTRTADFERGASTDTAVLLTVHPSNFRIEGFTETPDRIARQHTARELDILHIEDAGSGSLDSVGGEPGVRDAVAAGVDLVLFSADKLLGGPQAGLAIGRADVVQRLRRHPMYRAMRLDKTRIAALEATLAQHLVGELPPVDFMLNRSEDALLQEASTLHDLLIAAQVTCEIIYVNSATGGGARPRIALASRAVRVPVRHPDAVIHRLRTGAPAILARIVDDAVVLDVRTLPKERLNEVAREVARAVVSS